MCHKNIFNKKGGSDRYCGSKFRSLYKYLKMDAAEDRDRNPLFYYNLF